MRTMGENRHQNFEARQGLRILAMANSLKPRRFDLGIVARILYALAGARTLGTSSSERWYLDKMSSSEPADWRAWSTTVASSMGELSQMGKKGRGVRGHLWWACELWKSLARIWIQSICLATARILLIQKGFPAGVNPWDYVSDKIFDLQSLQLVGMSGFPYDGELALTIFSGSEWHEIGES